MSAKDTSATAIQVVWESISSSSTVGMLASPACAALMQPCKNTTRRQQCLQCLRLQQSSEHHSIYLQASLHNTTLGDA